MSGLGKFPPFPIDRLFQETDDASLVGGITRNPVGFPYEYQDGEASIFTALYRVKKFRLQYSASGLSSSGELIPQSPYNVTFDAIFAHGSSNTGFQQFAGFTSERDLVTYAVDDVSRFGVHFSANVATSGTVFAVTLFFYAPASFGTQQRRVFESLYYPDLLVNVSHGSLGAPALGVGGATTTPGVKSPVFEGSFLGRPCPYYFHGPVAFNQFVVDTSSFVVSAEEYWEYDPADGAGPIWDSASGDQIRDRWSVQQWS
jgi:hypothetical protein